MKNLFHKITKKDQHRERSGVFPNGKIEHMSVIMEENQFENKDTLTDLKKKTGLKLKPEHILVYNDQKNIEAQSDCSFFSKKDFGFFGKIKNQEVVSFLSNDFDLLVNYCNPDNEEARMILLKTKAKLVAGFDDNQVLQDFSFKIDRSDLLEFNSELSKYLKKFELI